MSIKSLLGALLLALIHWPRMIEQVSSHPFPVVILRGIILEGLTFATRCTTLEVTCLSSAYSSLVRTSHMALADDNSLGSTILSHPQNAEKQKYVGRSTNDYHRDINNECLEQTKSILNSLKSLRNLASSHIYSEEKEARLGREMIRKNGEREKEEKDKNIRKQSRKVEKEQIKENTIIPKYSSSMKGYVSSSIFRDFSFSLKFPKLLRFLDYLFIVS